MGNGEAKELMDMTHGHELRGQMLVGWGCMAERGKGEKKNGTTNSMINKIYLKKGSTNECINKWSNKSMSLSLLPFLSLSNKINLKI